MTEDVSKALLDALRDCVHTLELIADISGLVHLHDPRPVARETLSTARAALQRAETKSPETIRELEAERARVEETLATIQLRIAQQLRLRVLCSGCGRVDAPEELHSLVKLGRLRLHFCTSCRTSNITIQVRGEGDRHDTITTMTFDPGRLVAEKA